MAVPAGYTEYYPAATQPPHQHACKLIKSLYGTKQAQLVWNTTLNKTMVSLNYKCSTSDPCMYIRDQGSTLFIALIWVDDIITLCANAATHTAFHKELAKHYKMRDLGPLEWCLNLKFTVDPLTRAITLNQTHYVEAVLARFDMTDCKPVNTLTSPTPLRKTMWPSNPSEEKEMLHTPYREAVGTLMYLMTCTRPDISFAVNQVCRYMQNPGPQHWVAVKRII